MGRCTSALCLVYTLLLVLQPPVAEAQTVLEVLTNLFTQQQTAVAQGATNLLRLWQTPIPETNLQLPECRTANVLLNEGGFPRNWSQLTAEQQVLHPINLVMLQLAYAAYQPAETFSSCLQAMGIRPNSIKSVQGAVPEYATNRTALVMQASNQRIFITFKGSDLNDVTINMACRHNKPIDSTFGTKNANIGVHQGFWRGWQALEKDVVHLVQLYLKQVPSGEVYIVGHSLGAAVASIAALRLNTLLAQSNGYVAGVWLIASPRPGSPEFTQAYNRALLSKTLRFSNVQDFAVQVPALTQHCSVGSSNQDLLSRLTESTAQFKFAHVGRSVLMCPDARSGLTHFKVAPEGSENVYCGSSDNQVDASGATHQIGSYFDAWRRGYLAMKGSNLASDPRVLAVLCQACTFRADNVLEQIAVPARPGGPVTCAVDASCSSRVAFDAATAVGTGYATAYSQSTSQCGSFICEAA